MTTESLTIIVLIFVLLINVYAAYSFRQENQQLKKRLAYYDKAYLTHQGGGSLTAPSYHIASFDGGLTWFNVTHSGSGLTITGQADPGLVQRIEALDRLVAHARTHGPIGSRPFTEADVAALEGAGFTVEEKP